MTARKRVIPNAATHTQRTQHKAKTPQSWERLAALLTKSEASEYLERLTKVTQLSTHRDQEYAACKHPAELRGILLERGFFADIWLAKCSKHKLMGDHPDTNYECADCTQYLRDKAAGLVDFYKFMVREA